MTKSIFDTLDEAIQSLDTLYKATKLLNLSAMQHEELYNQGSNVLTAIEAAREAIRSNEFPISTGQGLIDYSVEVSGAVEVEVE